MATQTTPVPETTVVTPAALLEHWQGHRRLTRRMIEAFPDDKLFTYSVGGMRPFSELVLEFLGMAVPGMNGVATRKWTVWNELEHHQKTTKPTTKAELLSLWDKATEEINRLWAEVPSERFMETDKAFGMWEGPIWWLIFYWIDNEIHHRGQAYVYLRSLGIEPPPFYER